MSTFQSFINNHSGDKNCNGNSNTNYIHVDPEGNSAVDQTVSPSTMGESLPWDHFTGAEWSFCETDAVNSEFVALVQRQRVNI